MRDATRSFHASGPGTPAPVWRAALDPGRRTPLTLDGVRRVVVVSAHPDNESLAAGGLTATASAAGLRVDLVCVTDGEKSHPWSPTHTEEALAARRSAEYVAAAAELGVPELALQGLHLPDGSVRGHADRLTTTLVDLIGDGRGTVLAVPWAEDGHPDHEAVGRAAAATARRTDAELWEFPVWFWHWATPDDSRALALRELPLTAAAVAAKHRAVAQHTSQISPLSRLEGDEAPLTPGVLDHFDDTREWFVVTPGSACADNELENVHVGSSDPWGVDSRWYERRKRDLLLAALPRAHFRRALEIGCSTGALTEALTARADHVLGIDRSATALRAARRRIDRQTAVSFAELDAPTDWPDGGPFDLVVVSEVGYFLSPAALDRLVERIAGDLADDGVVVLCHWRHPMIGWVLDATAVHRAFETEALPALRAEYRDQDVEIRVHASRWPAHDA